MQYKRLKKNNDFQKLFKKGKRVFSPYITIIYTPAKDGTTMGIALSKKHGKAVKRNRIKRVIRSAFSNNIDFLSGSYNMVIMPKAGAELTYNDAERSLLSCFKRMEK